MIRDPGAGAQRAAVIKMAEVRRGECQDAGGRGVARMVPGGEIGQGWGVSRRVKPDRRDASWRRRFLRRRLCLAVGSAMPGL